MPDAREQAEAVARFMGWTPADGMWPWKSPSGNAFSRHPDYDSLDAMREVEDEIERRGLMPRYERSLLELWANDSSNDSNINVYLIRASALQRLQAAARVIEEVGK